MVMDRGTCFRRGRRKRHARRVRSPEIVMLPLRLSGLEPLVITADTGFVVVGERTNITGSPKFSKLILAHDFEGALAVACQAAGQARAGAR